MPNPSRELRAKGGRRIAVDVVLFFVIGTVCWWLATSGYSTFAGVVLLGFIIYLLITGFAQWRAILGGAAKSNTQKHDV